MQNPQKPQKNPSLECGFVVGCNATLEPLLPWWWSHYEKYHKEPVLFVDFGLSEKGAAWCREKGLYEPLKETPHPLPPLEDISPETLATWNKEYSCSQALFSRGSWQKKPYALLKSPFDAAIWIDIDCQIQAPLDPIFHLLELGSPLALVRETLDIDRPWLKNIPLYNSGVIGFQKNTPILSLWANAAAEEAGRLAGDQESLSLVLHRHKFPFAALPLHYNFPYDLEGADKAAVRHFCSPGGKLALAAKLDGEKLYK